LAGSGQSSQHDYNGLGRWSDIEPSSAAKRRTPLLRGRGGAFASAAGMVMAASPVPSSGRQANYVLPVGGQKGAHIFANAGSLTWVDVV